MTKSILQRLDKIEVGNKSKGKDATKILQSIFDGTYKIDAVHDPVLEKIIADYYAEKSKPLEPKASQQDVKIVE